MSDETAFLTTIATTPEDNTARLVFADWLDEQDDFRAEFVRAGVAFEATPPYNPERFRLAQRLRQLLESKPFQEWLPQSPAITWSWRKGFPAATIDSEQLLTLAEDDEQFATKVTQCLSSLWIEQVTLKPSGLYRGLWAGSPADSGDESDNEADTKERDYRTAPDHFEMLRKVRALRFDSDDYGSGLLKRLRHWPHLRELAMPYFYGEWPQFAELQQLRSLTLGQPDWEVMPKLHEARLPQLEVLELDKEWNDELPEWNVCFPRLRSLTLTQYNSYPDEQCERFAACPELRHLGLHARYEPLTRSGLQAIARAKKLRSLHLGLWPKVTVATLAKLKHLEHLSGDNLREPIRGLEELVQLRWLSFCGSDRGEPFTNAVAQQLLALPNLTRVDMPFKEYEPGAIATLAKASALRVLVVREPDTFATVEELSQLHQLKFLRVIPNYEIRPSERWQISRWETRLPNCTMTIGYDWHESEYDWS